MQSLTERPRELRWYHAAGLLYGDWGTSRLYVLGLAFVLTGPPAFWYIAAMCGLVTLVGLAYTIICKHFPDGGGVYSSARLRSPSLGVIGALLLTADYIVTAALSAYEGFRYLLPTDVSPTLALYAAIGAILVMGAVNWVGPRRAGLFALIIALTAGVFYLMLGVFCLRGVPEVTIPFPTEPLTQQWSHFVQVILALSGVEAIANMTGVMAEPVGRNSRRAILLVLAEVVILNLVIAYAMSAIEPILARHDPVDARDHMIRIIAAHFAGPTFATISSGFFGILLISAANTAIGGMISIQYLLGRDGELPASFTGLNRFGVPRVGLAIATLAPILVLMLVGSNTTLLAGLYAIGVVGAIGINLLSSGTNLELDLQKWERGFLLIVGGLIALIEITIAIEKDQALLFAGTVVGVGLAARQFARYRRPVLVPAAAPEMAAEAAPRVVIPPGMLRYLVPSRGGPKLMQFAVNLAKDRKAALLVLFIREVSLSFRERNQALGGQMMTLARDQEARRVFAQARAQCEAAKVPMLPIYVVYDSPAEVILDQAATHGADAVLMGVSRRGALWRTLKGDVLQEVINYLPEQIPLLIHA